LALEFGCSLAQGAIGTDFAIQPSEKQIAVSIRQMDSVMACKGILGRAQESAYDKISDCLMRRYRRLLDLLFRLSV